MTQQVRISQLDLNSIFTGIAVIGISATMVGMVVKDDKPKKQVTIIPIEPTAEDWDIATAAGLSLKELMVIPREDKERKRRKPPKSTKTVEVGSYVIIAEYRDTGCTVKLYRNLPNWKRKLVATQTAESLPECDRLFRKTVDAARQARVKERQFMP